MMRFAVQEVVAAVATDGRVWLDAQVAAGRLAPGDLAPARSALGLVPSAAGWQRIITGTLAAAGLVLLATALVFAVAFNWDALGHFTRFALVQGVVLLLALVAWRCGIQSLPGEAALFAACLGVGALLALFGQTYQTGADPYSLFVGWAALILPWAWSACRASLWLLWIAVANLGLALYCGQVLGESSWIHRWGHLEGSAGLAILFNLSLFGLFEFVPVLGGSSLGRAVPRVVAIAVLAGGAAVLIAVINRRELNLEGIPQVLGLLGLALASFAGLSWWSLQRWRDLPVLASAALGAVLVGFTLMLRLLPNKDSFGVFLLGAVYWIGAIALAVRWLRRLGPGGPANTPSQEAS